MGYFFHQKSFDIGLILVKQSLEEGHIQHELWKTVKSAIFCGREILWYR